MKHYGISELVGLTGLSRRTIRFYIKEGLIDPPEGAGRNARYSQTHLLRLRLIAILKESTHLRLEGIREQLDGMDSGQLRDFLAKLEQDEESVSIMAALDLGAPFDGRVAAMEPENDEHAASGPIMGEPACDGESPGTGRRPPESRAVKGLLGRLTGGSSWKEAAAPDEAQAWARVRVGDDVEIHYRQGADKNVRARVKEIVAFARKIIGSG